ncbi:MAG TPA: UvrD-helicase domain-containing protein [Candidatus Dormibacteraeota bacterium]
MAIPSTTTIAACLLRALDCDQVLSLDDVRGQLADDFDLSTDERTALVNPNSKETKLANRVGHARTLLVRLGLAEQPARSALQISAEGRAVLAGDRAPRTGIKNATSAGLFRALDANTVTHPGTVRAAAPLQIADVAPEGDARETDDGAGELDVESVREPIPELAAPLVPGPRALGRSIVLGPEDPVPASWEGLPEIAVTPADVLERTGTVDRLHRAWARRRPLIIRLHVDAAALRRPATWTKPLWHLAPRFDPWADRLLFLVWNNSYDGRGGRAPRWHWTALAARAGGTATPDGPADVRLPSGEPAWVDGGPRRPFARGTFGDQRILHHLDVEAGSLLPAAPLTEPRAGLAAEQLRAVRHLSGGARVIAPAGSGKTRVLTERLRHLVVDRRYGREQVVAVAYNKRAQEEMERRTADFAPRVQTLNSLGWAILRDAVPGVQLIDASQRRKLIEQHCPILDRRANTDPVAPYLDALENTRQGLRDPAEVEATFSDIPGFAAAFRGYRAELIERNLADYDEQLYRTCELLLGNAELRRSWQRRCRHLLVDEFQDLTPLHLLLIRTLASPALDVFGTGDDDQVIYGYAGADPRFLIDFADLFPGAAAHALELNYRCPPAVVAAASTLLTHNRVRVRKKIRAARVQSSTPDFTVLQHSADATAETISAVVRDWLDAGSTPRSIAVLCRVNASLLTPQVALHTDGVPVVNAVSTEILQRTGVRSALAYLRLALAPTAMQSSDLDEAARRPSRAFTREVLDDIRGRRVWTMADLRAPAGKRPGRFVGRVYDFIDALRDVRRAVSRGDTRAVLNAIRQVGLEQAMQKLDATSLAESHIDDLDALVNLAGLHPDVVTFESWLREVLARPSGRDGVTLATVHKVKGEEWDRVLVADVRDGILPHRRAPDVEEERRILHVAITRGRGQVVVLSDRARPSPFIQQLSDPWVEPRPAPAGARGSGSTQKPPTEKTISAREGMTLEANGGYRGTIVSIDGGGVHIATASGGRLKIRYGERVTVNDEVLVLAAP